MSTIVDKDTKPRAPRTSAAETRDRLLTAARVKFSRGGFDEVGVRDIAATAGVDPAMVIRLFGSKEALFTAVARTAFDLEPAFTGPLETLGATVANHLLGPYDPSDRAQDFDAFQFLLRSAASRAAAPILATCLQESFVAPLAQRIGRPDAEGRAALITAYVLGVATLRFGLTSLALDAAPPDVIEDKLAKAIQACLD